MMLQTGLMQNMHDFPEFTCFMRRPIFGNEILESNAGDLSNCQIATRLNYDLQKPHQMLGCKLNLQKNTNDRQRQFQFT